MRRTRLRTVKLGGIVVVLALCVMPVHGHHEAPLSEQAIHTLTPIDSIPTKDDLESVLSATPIAQLRDIAISSEFDFGVRLRAIRALPHFCAGATCAGSGDPAHAAILFIFGSINLGVTDPEMRAKEVLRLRAAIEALGVARSNAPEDFGLLLPFLANSSRDIRVAAARALRDLCNTQAIVPLRARYQQEQVPQVRLAISAALRDLEQCGQ